MTKEDEPYNAGDKKKVADAEKQRKITRDQELEDVRQLLNNPSGLRFLRRLMAEGRVFHTTFTGNSQGMFLEGHRNLALMFFHDVVEAEPNKVSKLILVGK